MNFLYRKDRLQLSSCNKHLLTDGEHTTAEISLWHDEKYETTRHTIAKYKRCNEGYDLVFCGNRPFSEDVRNDEFMYLAKLGQELLTEYFYR